MANSIYLTLSGNKQGLISAGCSSVDSIGNKGQESHLDKIFIYSLSHSMTREQNASHHPITIKNLLINRHRYLRLPSQIMNY